LNHRIKNIHSLGKKAYLEKYTSLKEFKKKLKSNKYDDNKIIHELHFWDMTIKFTLFNAAIKGSAAF